MELEGPEELESGMPPKEFWGAASGTPPDFVVPPKVIAERLPIRVEVQLEELANQPIDEFVLWLEEKGKARTPVMRFDGSVLSDPDGLAERVAQEFREYFANVIRRNFGGDW